MKPSTTGIARLRHSRLLSSEVSLNSTGTSRVVRIISRISRRKPMTTSLAIHSVYSTSSALVGTGLPKRFWYAASQYLQWQNSLALFIPW